MAKFFHYVLFLFALVAIMELMVEAADCRRELADCTPDCNDICAKRYSSDGQGGCENNKCVCIFTCGTERRCTVPGLGRCSDSCGDQCCKANCAAKIPGSAGIEAFCDASLGAQNALCSCSYDCS